MKHSQAYQLSRDISAMQATVLTTLRRLDTELKMNDGDQRLYARWYCKRAITQELDARVVPSQGTSVREDPQLPANGAAAPATADSAHSWADQVQTYLLRKRNALASPSALSTPLE